MYNQLKFHSYLLFRNLRTFRTAYLILLLTDSMTELLETLGNSHMSTYVQARGDYRVIYKYYEEFDFFLFARGYTPKQCAVYSYM